MRRLRTSGPRERVMRPQERDYRCFRPARPLSDRERLSQSCRATTPIVIAGSVETPLGPGMGHMRAMDLPTYPRDVWSISPIDRRTLKITQIRDRLMIANCVGK